MRHTRSRTGCLTCRRDGYKCDEARPICGRCNRLNKTCQGYGVQLRWRQVEPERQRSPRQAGLGEDGGPSHEYEMIPFQVVRQDQVSRSLDMLPDTSSLDRKALHHWMTTLAATVSMAPGPTNPFLTELTPLLVESPSLRYAVSSMGATHLSLLQSDSKLRAIGDQHRLRAIAGLRQTIESGDAELSLAVVLMLQIADRLFTADSPADHLAGARAIISRAGGRDKQWPASTIAFLRGLYFYHDVVASVSRGSYAHVETENVAIEGMHMLHKLTLVLRIVGRISEMRKMDAADPTFNDKGNVVQNMLNMLEDSDPDTDVRKTTEAYRQAAFIYLYRTWYHIGAPHPLTLAHVDACLRLLEGISTSSALQSAHVWPLWTAGCESIDAINRHFVRQRLQSMFQLRRLPYLDRILSDIEEVWSVKDAHRQSTGTDKVDCIQAILANRNRAADIV